MANSNSSNANVILLANYVPATKPAFSSSVFIGITNGGNCVFKGFGELEASAADLVAMNLNKLANRIRAAAQRSCRTL